MNLLKSEKEFKVNNFDLIRLFAATEVIVDHYFQHLQIPISTFSQRILYILPGVPTFFILSGFLISASYERNNNLRIYFKNRALRIFPGLWVVIFMTIVVFSITGISFLNKQVIAWLPSQLAGIIYTPGFLKNYGYGSYNGSIWTIPVELQFYILLPLCYLLAPKKKNLWLFGLLAVFIGTNIWLEFKFGDNITDLVPKLISYSFLPHFYLFLTGVILQRLNIYKSAFIYNKALYWIIGYVLYCLLLPDYINTVIFTVIKHIFLAFCILSAAYTLPGTATKLLRTNDISYGIYIYHGLVINVMIQERLTKFENVFLIIGISYVLGYLSWIFVEKPFIRRKERTIRKLEG